jgi:hypothetical protein
VKVKGRMADEPRFGLGMFVSRVVVGHQVQLEGYRDISIEMSQKGAGSSCKVILCDLILAGVTLILSNICIIEHA